MGTLDRHDFRVRKDVLRRDTWRERYDGTTDIPEKILRGAGGEIVPGSQPERRFLGKIDFSDKDALEALAKAFCEKYAKSPVENMLVVTKDGEVYFVTDNNPNGVDCTFLGDKLKGSWNIHTHPPDSTQFSFSTDVDMPVFFEDGSAVMEAVDYKYRYRFERPAGVTLEMWEQTRYEVESQIRSIMTERGFGMDDFAENVQHVLMEETCKKLRISSYSREVLK